MNIVQEKKFEKNEHKRGYYALKNLMGSVKISLLGG